ncbi:lipopolysaccharide biosynthesis protein [Aliivibrio fischeri]|uniref:lipopolysaccharide biosynthesis protein n=1 Tax=Aliivibrio fischeri TaxID=668 RepID=UPI0012DA04E2|nr:oligosaccharide flippase family protein [Aliivibrio fischeri]MUL16632.1 oligosaccharide flippase family protein [Aliivibrio fischeri]
MGISGKYKYILLELVNKGVPFLMLPLFSHLLTTVEYSELEVMMTMFTFAQLFCWFNVNTYYSKVFYSSESYDENRSDLVLLPVLMSILILIITAALFFILKIKQDFYFILLMISIVIFQFIFQINLIRYQFTNNFKMFALLQLSATTINIIMSYSLVVFDFGAIGRFVGLNSGNSIIGIIAFFYWLYFTYNKKYNLDFLDIKEQFYFGLKLIPFNIMNGWLKDNIAKIIMITVGVSSGFVGIYGLSFSYSSAFNVIINALMVQLTPKIYKNKLNENILKYELKKHFYLLTVLLFILLPLICMSFYYLVDESYHAGISLIPIFIFSFYFNSISLVCNVRLLSFNKESKLSYISFFYAIIYISMVFFFVDVMGFSLEFSVALSYLLGALVQSIISIITVKVCINEISRNTI